MMMKKRFFLLLILLSVFFTAGVAYSAPSDSVSSPAASSPQPVLPDDASDAVAAPPAAGPADANTDEYQDDEYNDSDAGAVREERVEIADPLEPVNRAVHQFNDKLYYWALKPVARGYKAVVPEPARIGVRNFFNNLRFPARFLSCLLQADFKGAATETGRFTINTVWGIGGLMDPASGKELNLLEQDTDLGQTLGVWGVGQGFYIVWPILGPSSPRDTVSIAGDYFIYPVSYISPWYAWLGVRTYQEVNATSLRIGDYEALKEAAIDPYIAFRDAYAQYRFKNIKARKAKLNPAAPPAESAPAVNPALPKKEN